MEKRFCKLCNKSFLNGRALGGHMRSHMVTLQTPPPPPLRKTQFIESVSSSSNSSSSEEEEKGVGYGLRENPKKSFRLVDPEFSFAVDAGSSVVVQDRESDAESSKNPSRRRSKRTRKSGFLPLVLNGGLMKQEAAPVIDEEGMKKQPKWSKISKVESPPMMIEPEPMSSVSDTSPEEDVALCLMMLSRGTWKKLKETDEEEGEAEYEAEEEDKVIGDSEEEEDDSSIVLKQFTIRNRGKYHCGTCKKVFKSYQALGGHRASHKKIKSCAKATAGTKGANNNEHGANNIEAVADRKIHECPICFRVFGSGQALGGHKRSHLTASATPPPATTTPIANVNTNSAKFGDNLIDLNLPAPLDDDDIGSQVEISAVSDAEFQFGVPIK